MQGFLGVLFSDVIQILGEGKFEIPDYPPIRPGEEKVGEMSEAEKAIATITFRLKNSVPRAAENDSADDLKRKSTESYTLLQRVRLLMDFLLLLIGERFLGEGDPKKHAGFAIRQGGVIVLIPVRKHYTEFYSLGAGSPPHGGRVN